MNNEIISRWNYRVKPSDFVFHLGDFGMGSKEELEKIVKKLHGQKNLILGNHDRYKPTDYMEIGFYWASRYPILFNSNMWLSHEELNLNTLYYNIHGHTHNSESFYSENKPNHFNLSVEGTGYFPISLNNIEKSIKHKIFNVTAEHLVGN
jgi:calcineurin-like phosphoesterase family protein